MRSPSLTVERLPCRQDFRMVTSRLSCSFLAGEGGSKVGETKRGKRTKIMAVADRHGLPVAVCIECYTPRSEVGHFHPRTDDYARAPQNLIGGNAYDSD